MDRQRKQLKLRRTPSAVRAEQMMKEAEEPEKEDDIIEVGESPSEKAPGDMPASQRCPVESAHEEFEQDELWSVSRFTTWLRKQCVEVDIEDHAFVSAIEAAAAQDTEFMEKLIKHCRMYLVANATVDPDFVEITAGAIKISKTASIVSRAIVRSNGTIGSHIRVAMCTRKIPSRYAILIRFMHRMFEEIQECKNDWE